MPVEGNDIPLNSTMRGVAAVRLLSFAKALRAPRSSGTGSRPPRRQDAQEEGQLRGGGGEGGAQEEIGEVVS